jgi:hypothetical protein
MMFLSVLVTFGLLVAYVTWATTPRVKYPELLKKILLDATEYHSFRQRHAHDPALNGYLHPDFLSFWGTFDDRGEDGSIEQAIKNWARFSSGIAFKPVLCSCRSQSGAKLFLHG